MELKERYDVSRLVRPGGIGIELGVAEGVFSEQVLLRSRLSFLYSVDMYAGDRGHDDEQYRQALTRLMGHRSRNAILRMRFDEAIKLFPDNYFDFIYIDGYAHTGQESGSTLREWFSKLKDGGVYAGDDYSEVWPENLNSVNQFANDYNLSLSVIYPSGEVKSPWCEQPTWWTIK